MRLLKYLGKHLGAVALVFLLLIGQAFCDLMLPNYTAQIVDVGIQQSGVERVSPATMTTRTFELVAALIPAKDEERLRACYQEAPDKTIVLTQEGDQSRDWLDSTMAFPLIVSNALAQLEDSGGVPTDDAAASSLLDATGISASPALIQLAQSLTPEQRSFLSRAAQSGDLSAEALLGAYREGLFPKDLIVAFAQAARDSVPVSDDLVQQQAIAATKAEYERVGVDLEAMQLNYLLITAAKMMGFVALSVVIAILVGLIASRTGAKIGRELRNRLFEKVLSFSDAEMQRFSTASLITRGTNDIQLIQMMSIMLMRMVLYAPILAIGGIIMIARTDLSMGWIIAVAIALLLVAMFTLMAIAMPKFRIMQKLVDRVNLISREMLTGVSVVRAFGQQDREQRRFDVASHDLMSTQLFTNRVMTFMMPAMMLIMNGISVIIVWTGAQSIDLGTIQTGDLIAFITYSMVIIMGFLMLGMLVVIAPRADVSARRVDEVLEAEVSIVDHVPSGSPRAASADAGVRLAPANLCNDEKLVPAESLTPASADAARGEPAVGARIEFDHVSFRYDEGSEYVLSDVSFVAEAGKTCAIIGSTGSGKSTILKLIERFYDVSDGAVWVDGVDVRDMALHDLRSQFGYVPQRAFLFTGTIGSNVGYGVDEPSDEQILQAVDIAQVRDLVDSDDDGLEAEITQGGTNVSGGQRQRLAIARALATNARAFLFDDSFSALDYKTDAALRQALAMQMGGKTQIVVAQRIATVLHADKIIVLDEGRIVGEGTHAQLMGSCQQYREIAYSQLAPEELEDEGAAVLSAGSFAEVREGGDPR